MALPATDNFNRIGPTLGTNWTDLAAAFTIVGNKAVATTEAESYWSADSFNADQYSQVVVDGSNYSGVIVRASGAPGAGNYYALFNLGSIGLYLYIGNSGVRNIIDAGNTTPAVNGDLIRLEVSGSILSIYLNGVFKYNHTDATHVTGAAGICGVSGSSPALDDWEGGNIGSSGPTVDQMLPVFMLPLCSGIIGIVNV